MQASISHTSLGSVANTGSAKFLILVWSQQPKSVTSSIQIHSDISERKFYFCNLRLRPHKKYYFEDPLTPLSLVYYEVLIKSIYVSIMKKASNFNLQQFTLLWQNQYRILFFVKYDIVLQHTHKARNEFFLLLHSEQK